MCSSDLPGNQSSSGVLGSVVVSRCVEDMLEVKPSTRQIGFAFIAGIAATCCGCGAAHTHNMTGVQQFNTGNLAGARTEFQQAITADPTNADANYNMASTLHKMASSAQAQGRTAEAKDLYAQAESQYNHALDMYDRSKDSDPGECYRGLAVLLVETDRSDKAFTLVRNWLVSNPTSAEARLRLAQLYEEFGQSDEAVHYLQEALAQNPNNTKALNALAKLRESSGDLQQAIANYQRSLQINAQQPAVAGQVAALQRQAAGVGGAAANVASNPTVAPATTPSPGTTAPVMP